MIDPLVPPLTVPNLEGDEKRRNLGLKPPTTLR